MEIGKIYDENCLITMQNMPDNYIDFVITSPPYDDIRNYNGYQFEFEKIAQQHAYSHIVLHARETAVPFYKALGYKLYDNRFYEIDIPHFAMQKHLK